MSGQGKKMSTGAKITLGVTCVSGVFICLHLPWWTFIILGAVLFFEYAGAVASQEEPAADEEAADSGKEGDAPEEKDPEEEDPDAASPETSGGASERYDIYIKELHGFDIDALNKLYRKLIGLDRFRYPAIGNIAGKKKFPEPPLLLFENLTKSQCDLFMPYLPTLFSKGGGTVKLAVRKSTVVFPDNIAIRIGTLFTSDTIEFVKVTGFREKYEGICEDFWVATKPVTYRNIELVEKKLKKRFGGSAIDGESFFRLPGCCDNQTQWQKRNPRIQFYIDHLRDCVADEKPYGFHIGLLTQQKFTYALKGGQYGSPYKHPGTDSAEEFLEDQTVNALGMCHLAGRFLFDAEINVCMGVYSPKECKTRRLKLEETRRGRLGKIWLGLRTHAGIMVSALKYRNEQLAKQREREEEQQAADAAVLRRQKLMQKRKEGEGGQH